MKRSAEDHTDYRRRNFPDDEDAAEAALLQEAEAIRLARRNRSGQTPQPQLARVELREFVSCPSVGHAFVWRQK